MKTQAISISLTKEFALEKRIRRIVVFLILASIALYAFLISASVLHIIARRDAHTEMARVQSSIAQLESDYFVYSKNITPLGANNLGLVQTSSKAFVTRTTPFAAAQGISNNEI